MQRSSLMMITLVLAACLPLAGCPRGEPQPVEIVLSEDSCSVCRMAVSDKKFAAEAVAPDGHVDYFDDIGCLIEFVRTQPPAEGSKLFTVDFDDQRWLDAESAAYLYAREKGRELPTPMSYGLAAFATADAAAKAAQQWPGRVLKWDELMLEFQP